MTGGPVTGNEAALRAMHLEPYRAAIAARVGSMMLSYNIWQGTEMHVNKAMITDVLKGELGFGGFVVTDYNGCFQAGVSGVSASLGRVPQRGRRHVHDLRRQHGRAAAVRERHDGPQHIRQLVESNTVPMSRLDDAVRRILAVKCEMGLFDSDGVIDTAATARVGSAAHRMVARHGGAEVAGRAQERRTTCCRCRRPRRWRWRATARRTPATSAAGGPSPGRA